MGTFAAEHFRPLLLFHSGDVGDLYMRVPFVICTALILSASTAWAFDSSATPLAAGKPAGLHQAQLLEDGNGMLLVAGAALVGITIALATASNDVSQASGTSPGSSSSTSTTGTNP
jgi:hypothetical protein